MLFNARINEIQAQVSNNVTEIDAMMLRIEALRVENLALESHLQQLGSAESAAESAIEQIRTALLMIDSISPAEVATFKEAIDELFSKEVPLLNPVVDTEANDGYVQFAPAVRFERTDSDDVVDTEAGDIPDEVTDGSDGVADGGEFPSDYDYSHVDPEELLDIGVSDLTATLNKLALKELRKLAKQRQLDCKGAKFILIHRLLNSGIDAKEVSGFTAGSSVA